MKYAKSLLLVGVLMLSMVGVVSAAGYVVFGNDIINKPGQPQMVDTFPNVRLFTTEASCLDALDKHRKTSAKFSETDANGVFVNVPKSITFNRIHNATCQLIQ